MFPRFDGRLFADLGTRPGAAPFGELFADHQFFDGETFFQAVDIGIYSEKFHAARSGTYDVIQRVIASSAYADHLYLGFEQGFFHGSVLTADIFASRRPSPAVLFLYIDTRWSRQIYSSFAASFLMPVNLVHEGYHKKSDETCQVERRIKRGEYDQSKRIRQRDVQYFKPPKLLLL
jgi:hypothetical protein